jgi:hypothetical protein
MIVSVPKVEDMEKTEIGLHDIKAREPQNIMPLLSQSSVCEWVEII